MMYPDRPWRTALGRLGHGRRRRVAHSDISWKLALDRVGYEHDAVRRGRNARRFMVSHSDVLRRPFTMIRPRQLIRSETWPNWPDYDLYGRKESVGTSIIRFLTIFLFAVSAGLLIGTALELDLHRYALPYVYQYVQVAFRLLSNQLG